MKSAVLKRSVVISGHKTSVSLEDPFWSGLKAIAKNHKITLSDVIADIESKRQYGNLSSAIRLFVLDHARGDAPLPRHPAVNGDRTTMSPATFGRDHMTADGKFDAADR